MWLNVRFRSDRVSGVERSVLSGVVEYDNIGQVFPRQALGEFAVRQQTAVGNWQCHVFAVGHRRQDLVSAAGGVRSERNRTGKRNVFSTVAHTRSF
jgi:hypothetical protein